MATWQVSLHIMPRPSVLNEFGHIPPSVSREQYEDGRWWFGFPQSEELMQTLSAALPRRESWTSNMYAWGVEDGNRVDVWMEGDCIVEIGVRIDARDSQSFAHVLADMAARYDLLGVNERFSIRQLTAEQILLEVSRSPAAHFVSDPETFLKNLRGYPGLNLE